MDDPAPSIDPAVFREVLGHYPTGVSIVTGVHPDGNVTALVVGTFTSVSIDPPLVAFLPGRGSGPVARLRECPSLCINVLTSGQAQMVGDVAARRQDKLAGVEWHPAPSGAPILAGSLAWLDVRLTDLVEAGDHWIALCEVRDLAVMNARDPLLFLRGGFGAVVSLPGPMGTAAS